jgi:hypothetical protein
MEQSSEIGSLVLALSRAQGEFEGANKTSDNPFFKSKYADLHECIKAAKVPLSMNELAVIQTTDADENGVWVITTLAHSSGQWIRGRMLMKPKKDDDQWIGSSITYGRRYGFAAIVGLAQKDDDINASCNQTPSVPITNDQLIIMNDEIRSRGVDIKKLLAYAQVESLDQINQKEYDGILKMIIAKPVIEP